jgi:hypothetical protein
MYSPRQQNHNGEEATSLSQRQNIESYADHTRKSTSLRRCSHLVWPDLCVDAELNAHKKSVPISLWQLPSLDEET